MTDQDAGGFTVELWKAVSVEAGLSYQIHVYPFRDVLLGFKNGKLDVLINLAYSDERRVFADFTVPHVIVQGAIFVRRGESSIHEESDLAGKSIIVINADLAHDYAVSKGWGSNLLLVDTAAEGMRMLASGQADAMLLGKLTGMQALHALNLSNVQALKSHAGFSQKFCFAVPKGEAELLGKLNEGLSIVKSNGVYNALYEKWFGIYEEKEASFLDFINYLIPIGIAFVGIFWIFFARRRVERRLAELKLQAINQRFEMVLKALPDLMVELSREGRYLRLWGVRHEFLLMPESQLIGRTVVEMLPDDAAQNIMAAIEEADKTGLSFGQQIKLPLSVGVAWFELSVAKQTSDVSDETVYIVLFHDVSQAKRDEDAIRQSEARFRFLLENSPIAVRVTALDTNQVLFANKPYSQLVGLDLANVIGFSPFSEYNNQQDYEDVLLAIKGGYKIVDKLIEMKTVDQNSKWVLASYLPLEFHKIPTILGWFYDVTDRTQAERTRLQQVEMQRNALVREVHHRIKNNLQGIIGLLGIVAIQKPNAATAIHDVIGKLKSIAVVFGLQGRNQSDEILLQEVVFELCETARNITDASIVLMPSELICRTIRLDKDKAVAISLVMNELLTNAIKHNSGGVVSVDLRIELEEVVLSIVNPSEPSTLKWEQGGGLGTGLNLVRLMLPQNTSKLSLVLDSGQMTAQLCLVSPTVYF